MSTNSSSSLNAAQVEKKQDFSFCKKGIRSRSAKNEENDRFPEALFAAKKRKCQWSLKQLSAKYGFSNFSSSFRRARVFQRYFPPISHFFVITLKGNRFISPGCVVKISFHLSRKHPPGDATGSRVKQKSSSQKTAQFYRKKTSASLPSAFSHRNGNGR